MTSLHARASSVTLFLAVCGLVGCAERSRAYADGSTGGEGGASTASSGNRGGNQTVGGATDQGGTSGTIGVGGSAATTSLGGTSTSGGASASGGTVATSSSTGTGGASAVGGTKATGGTTAAGGSTAVTTTLACTATQLGCAGTCIDPTTNAKNCGSCGHDCGALSSCISSKCQPAPLVTELPTALGLDVSADGIFYSTAGTVQHCDDLVAPCVKAPSQVGSLTGASMVEVTDGLATNIVMTSGLMTYSARNNSYAYCTAANCSAFAALVSGANGLSINKLVSFGGDFYYQTSLGSPSVSYLFRAIGQSAGTIDTTAQITVASQVAADSPIAVDTNLAYFVRTDSAGATPTLVSCGRLSACTSFNTIVSGTPTGLAASAGYVYWVMGTPMNLYRRIGTGTTDTTTLASNITYSGGLVADATNLYWLSGTSIQYCTLPSCSGGIKTLVTGLTSPSNLRSYGNFLYWLVASTTTTGSTGAVYRIAKP